MDTCKIKCTYIILIVEQLIFSSFKYVKNLKIVVFLLKPSIHYSLHSYCFNFVFHINFSQSYSETLLHIIYISFFKITPNGYSVFAEVLHPPPLNENLSFSNVWSQEKSLSFD